MRHLFPILLFFLYFSAQTQDSFIHWIATEDDEYVKFISPYESDRILVNILQGDFSTTYSEQFTNYTNKLILLNYDFEVLNTVEINKVEGKDIIIYGVLDRLAESLILWGRSLSVDGLDNQLVILKVDIGFNILEYNFYGDPDQNEYFLSAVKDMNGDYIFTGTTSNSAGDGDIVFLKVNAMGEEVLYSINTDIYPYRTKFLPATEENYYLANSFWLHKTDTDFNVLESISTPDTLSVIPSGDYERYGDNQLVSAGTFMAPPIPGSPFVIDAGYVLFNEDFDAVSEMIVGSLDTTDFGKLLAVSGWDTLYFCANKNFTTNPVQESWVSIYKRHNTEAVNEWHIGGGDQYSIESGNPYYTAGSLETLENGGFVMGAMAWDFVNSPGDLKQRDVILFSENYGDTLVSIKPYKSDNNIQVFPQPASDHLNIRQNHKQLNLKVYDAEGKLVLVKPIFNNTTVRISGLPSGMYFYSLEKKGEILKSGKILKERK